MAAGNWFAFGNPQPNQGVLGDLEHIGTDILSAAGGGGTSGFFGDAGSVILVTTANAKKLTAAGLKGYNSEALAVANPNKNLSQSQITNILNTPVSKQVDTGLSQDVSNSVGKPIGSIEDFLSGLTSVNLWLRIGKIVIGGTILIVGLAHLTGLDDKATGIAKKALEVAPLL